MICYLIIYYKLSVTINASLRNKTIKKILQITVFVFILIAATLEEECC
jgi:hypothetical protein